MLKKKLSRQEVSVFHSAGRKSEGESADLASLVHKNPSTRSLDTAPSPVMTSKFFPTPFWKKFYDLECVLNIKLEKLKAPAGITHIYNPVEYAAELHCDYLRRYLDGPKKLLFVGMNPGPNGMAQTGVPFGNVKTVRELMQLSGDVAQPKFVHPKRPITGLHCTIEEPSGVRIWGLLQQLAGGSLDTFARQCFVHNFCPLVFYDKEGRNITPSELKGEYKVQVRDVCLNSLDELIKLVEPEVVVAVGSYVFDTLRNSQQRETAKMLKLTHPSPRVKNNQNWKENARLVLEQSHLLKYISNET